MVVSPEESEEYSGTSYTKNLLVVSAWSELKIQLKNSN